MRRALVEERAGSSLRHVAGCVEVGLTHFQVDDVSAGGLERPGTGGRLEGGLGPDALHAARESHGATSASNGLIGLGCPSVPMRRRKHRTTHCHEAHAACYTFQSVIRSPMRPAGASRRYQPP
jgi:hypothetical protein